MRGRILSIEKSRISEAFSLAEEIIRNIESNEIPLETSCLKAARLAGLLNDTDLSNKISGISSTIVELRASIETLKIAVVAYPQKCIEAMQKISNLNKTISQYKETVHLYATRTYYELKFSSVPQEIFERTRSRVDKKLSEMIPHAVGKFISVFENLRSENREDWSNAVHSCRRILKELADNLYPARSGFSEMDRGGKKIKVGPEEYVNRLMLYVEEKSTSETFKKIVGSHMGFLGNRLDSVYDASCKGSHSEIVFVEEAERYIIYTYMLIGDILTL